VPFRGVKLIVGLIVLLAWPWLGCGGSAQASFSLGQHSRGPERPRCSFGFEFELVINGEEQAEAGDSNPSGGMSGEIPSVPDSDPLRQSVLPRAPIPAHDGPQTSGTSSGPAPPSGPGGGGGSCLLPPLGAPLLGREGSGLLFLANERLKPPPFPSRLFRPPRRS